MSNIHATLIDQFDTAKQLVGDLFFLRGKCEYPQIIVSNISSNALEIPFNESIISEIRSNCISSSFGVGLTTKHDTNIRNSYELSSQQFKLNQFELSSQKSKLLENIRQKLAPQCSYITAEPYKLLIYEKGCFFKRHHDTMKSDNHFGSLILSIPYINNYEGGQFNLYYNSDSSPDDDENDGNQCYKKCYHWTPNQSEMNNYQNECEWIAFYSDTKHEIERVTKGIRITITLNLFYPNHELEENEEIDSRTYLYSPYIPIIYNIIAQNTHFPKVIIWIIINYFGDHNLIQTAQDILTNGEQKAIYMVSSHRYGGKQVNSMMLKGRDRFWYKWLIQYFNILITPILLKVIENYQYEYQDETDQHIISFGREYGGNDKDIDYDKKVQQLLGHTSFDDDTITILYNDRNKSLSIPIDTKEQWYWPEGDNGGNWEVSSKEYLYQCFGLLLTKKSSIDQYSALIFGDDGFIDEQKDDSINNGIDINHDVDHDGNDDVLNVYGNDTLSMLNDLIHHFSHSIV